MKMDKEQLTRKEEWEAMTPEQQDNVRIFWKIKAEEDGQEAIINNKTGEVLLHKIDEKEVKKPKLTKEQKKAIAIQKQQQELINARTKGFCFSNFNMFTNFLDIAKQFWDVQPFYYDEYKIWWLWNHIEKKWQKIDEVTLINAIDDHTESPTTNSGVKFEILEAMRRVGRRKKPKEPEKTWIQFIDDIYDLKTKQSFKASPDYFITNPIPWKLGEGESTPILDKILAEWVIKNGIQDESYVKTLQEIMAYCMLSYMPIHRIFCLIGEGLNGKGSFLRLVEKLVGIDNTCATELEVLSSIRFESSKLYKKLVCFIGEVDKGVFKKTKTLKSLTGEDSVRIEFKGKDGFDAKNYANPVIATNHLPETSDKTKGFFRRWTIVDFPNTFNEKKDIISTIPDQEFNNFCRKAIKILGDLIEKGEFTNDGTIEQRENKYEKHSNYINEFVKLYCDIDSEAWVEFSDFCEKYNEYLVNDGLGRKSKVEIGRILVIKGFVKKVKKVQVQFSYGSNDTTKVCVFGIKWKGDVGLMV
jgi:P4 family phage/plasmid primase-like protien